MEMATNPRGNVHKVLEDIFGVAEGTLHGKSIVRIKVAKRITIQWNAIVAR